MAPAPSGVTPDRTSVSIRSRCRIHRVLFDHDRWRRYNDRPLNDDRRSWLLDHDGGRRPILIGVSEFPDGSLELDCKEEGVSPDRRQLLARQEPVHSPNPRSFYA